MTDATGSWTTGRGVFLAVSGRMTSQALLKLATHLVKDLKAWSEEATRRDAITPEDLTVLQGAAEIVDRVTTSIVATSADRL
jgi:hypothetical protein